MLLVTYAWLPQAQANGTKRVVLLLSDSSAIYREAAEAIQAELESTPYKLRAKTIVLGTMGVLPLSMEATAEETLIVSIGLKATQAAIRTEYPTLSVLIPRQAYDSLVAGLAASRRKTLGAIYLDQPPKRHLDLVRAALPGAREVGLLIGPGLAAEPGLLVEWANAARDNGFAYFPVSVSSVSELFSALQGNMPSQGVLLIQPDPAIVNRNTVQNLMLATYRQRVPVIGYSRALVEAGSLTAVYSTPRQIGRQAGELVTSLARARGWELPPALYPKYFTVQSNASVSHALGLAMPEDASLNQRMEKGGS